METPFRETSRVFVDKDILSEEYQPDEILERDEEITEYANALQDVLEGWNPNNVFVYGKTGVGKTAVTRYMMEMLQYEASQRPDASEVSVISVNCRHHTSSYQAAIALINEFREDTPRERMTTGHSSAEVMDALYDEVERCGGTVLFVLDEIDCIGESDMLLYELPRARANDYLSNARVGIVGISNDYTFRQNLSPKVKDTLCESEIKFAPYDAGELQAILQDRADKALTDGCLEPGVIPRCAAVAARDRGSARQAIDLLREAGNVAAEDDRASVSEDDVEAAERRVERGRVKDSLRDLTTHGRLTMLAVAHAAERGQTPIRTTEIYDIYTGLTEQHGISKLGQRSVHDHLTDLSMLGFVERHKRNKGRRGGQYNEYDLDVQADAVFEVLESDD